MSNNLSGHSVFIGEFGEPQFATTCLICKEETLVPWINTSTVLICDKCRAAVMRMRKEMESNEQ